jgi:myo-inositol-1(or 4)-monophosphatase
MTAPPLLDELLAFAGDLAVRGGTLAVERAGGVAFSHKPDSSLVTELDYAVQRLILDAIAERYPDHAVVAEEHQERSHRHPPRADARYCWVIDPIDGTRNFVAGLPCFAVSIGLLESAVPVVGVVYEPNLGRLFTARRDRRTQCNRADVAAPRPPAGRDLLVGIPSSKRRPTLDILQRWLPRPGLVARNLGSTALHMAMVAAGALDAALCTKSKVWDIAAGTVLVRQAGGIVTDLGGRDPFPLLPGADLSADTPVFAAAPHCHSELMATIREALSAG